jgi:hypothetical protein
MTKGRCGLRWCLARILAIHVVVLQWSLYVNPAGLR